MLGVTVRFVPDPDCGVCRRPRAPGRVWPCPFHAEAYEQMAAREGPRSAFYDPVGPMRKFTKKVSFRVTAEEARAIAAMTRQGDFHMSVGELFRKLLASEVRRRRA